MLKEFRLVEQKSVDDVLFPLCLEMEEASSKESFFTWAATQGTEWKRLLLHHGAILLRGCPIDEPEDFERLLDDVGFPRMPYVGGAAPRTAVTSRVLSNESPPSEQVPFHHEMARFPIHLHTFFLLRPTSRAGGKTPIVRCIKCTSVSLGLTKSLLRRLSVRVFDMFGLCRKKMTH